MAHAHRAGLAAAAVGLALTLTACQSNDSPTSAPSRTGPGSGLDVTAGLDRETGAIVFPAERFVLSNEETLILGNALNHTQGDCLKLHDVPYEPFELTWDPEDAASNVYGVWTTPIAEQFGFVPPMPLSDMEPNGITIDGSLAPPAPSWDRPVGVLVDDIESVQPIIDECLKQPDSARFNPANLNPTGPWVQEINAAYELGAATEEAEAAMNDYHQCLKDNGMEPDPDSPLDVVGADHSAIDAEQISLALKVVACKDEVRLVERLAGEVAAFQAPVIDEYADEMIAHRARVDEAVDEARAYLAERGVQ